MNTLPARVAWIAAGSSLGDREAILQSAFRALLEIPDVAALQISPVYRTRPVGVASQPFFNAVARLEIEGHASAAKLLEHLLAIEQAHGRTRTCRWEDRTLDLDLLLIVDAQGDSDPGAPPVLELPHPRIAERDFVMQPWVDLAPGQHLPDGRALADLLSQLPAQARTIESRVSIRWTLPLGATR